MRPQGAEGILVEKGFVTAGQLDRALTLRRGGDRREVGEILRALGYLDGERLARVLALRLGLEYVELTDGLVDRGAADLVGREMLRRHRALPLRRREGRLVVAMADPTDVYAVEDLALVSGCEISPVVAAEEDIERVANRVLAIGAEVSSLLDPGDGETAGDDSGGVGVDLTDVRAGEGPAVRLVGSILQRAVADGASDVHLEPRAKELCVRCRVDGVLRELLSIPPGLQAGVVARLKVLADLDIAEHRVPQDGRLSVRLGRRAVEVRVATLPTAFGEKVVLRLLDAANVEVDLRSLGLGPDLLSRYRRVFRSPYGTILVTGPTGCGKSTTLYATLREIDSPEKNIVTVEDPVEYRVPRINQVQVNPKVGLGFASGLRSILRSDPDVVMIGEIRDRETARTSIEAALTGHLVFATLHTNDAASAITRLTDMGVEPFLTASAVDCLIAQRLARRLCVHCRRPAGRTPADDPDLAFPVREANFYEAAGCERCGETGYQGRIGVYEMMVLNAEIRDLILRRVPTGEISRAAERAGLIRLRQDGLSKAAAGVTTVEEILRVVV